MGGVEEPSSWLGRHVGRHRTLLGEFAFELIIVFVGVTGAFALENFREAREEAAYRTRMVAALRASLNDWSLHGREINEQVTGMLRNFDAARARGDEPALPVYRETGGERPPTKAWDGIVATGAARSLDPELFFRLARFYSRADSVGDRYQRYNSFSEERVLPYTSDKTVFYGRDGELKPEFAAYVDRLRDIRREEEAIVVEAGNLRDALPR
jgi:hypothetical protein